MVIERNNSLWGLKNKKTRIIEVRDENDKIYRKERPRKWNGFYG